MKSYKMFLTVLIVTNIYYFNSYTVNPEKGPVAAGKSKPGKPAEDKKKLIEENIRKGIDDALVKLNDFLATIPTATAEDKKKFIEHAKLVYSQIKKEIEDKLPKHEATNFQHKLGEVEHKMMAL